MKRMIANALALVAMGGLAACSSTPRPNFRTEAAPNAPISSYRTYAWAFEGMPRGATGNALTYQRVRQSLESSLNSAGFSSAPREQADMVVAFTLGARDRIDVTNWGSVGTTWPRYGRPTSMGWSMTYSQVDVRTVTEGSLAIDIFDGTTSQPVWQGIASHSLRNSGASDELIDAATSGLVQRFVDAGR